MYLITSIIQIFCRHTYTCQFMTLISFVDFNIRKQIQQFIEVLKKKILLHTCVYSPVCDHLYT